MHQPSVPEATAPLRVPKKEKLNNLQALRAFAAFGVVFYHTGYKPVGHPIGYSGVDLFFVISGFIMARICDTNPSFFLRRRIIRIVPPYWALTFIMFVAAKFFPSLMGLTRPVIAFLLKSLFFIPFYKSPGDIQPLLFLGWTLNFEMFFYLCIAAGLLFLPRRPILLASLFIVVITFTCGRVSHDYAITHFFSRWIVLEFPLGALAYHLMRRAPQHATRILRPLIAVCIAAALIFFVTFQALDLPFANSSWMAPGLTSFVLVFAASLLSRNGWDTKLQWIVITGDASYILYLVHPYCIFFLNRVLARHLPWLDITHLPGCLFACLVTVLVAIAIHIKVEIPTVNFLNSRFGGRRSTVEFKLKT